MAFRLANHGSLEMLLGEFTKPPHQFPDIKPPVVWRLQRYLFFAVRWLPPVCRISSMEPFSQLTPYLSFNLGMTIASGSYAALLATLQVVLSTESQVGRCTSYGQFIFWFGFSLFVLGAAVDLALDFGRMLSQRCNDKLLVNDSRLPNNWYSMGCFRPTVCRWFTPRRRRGFSAPYSYEFGNIFCCKRMYFRGNPNNLLEFECCGLRTSSCSETGEYSHWEDCCEGMLGFVTLLVRLISNAAIAGAIPVITMYNYLHSAPNVVKEAGCSFADADLEAWLRAAPTVALALIILRTVLLPTWTNAPGSAVASATAASYATSTPPTFLPQDKGLPLTVDGVPNAKLKQIVGVGCVVSTFEVVNNELTLQVGPWTSTLNEALVLASLNDPKLQPPYVQLVLQDDLDTVHYRYLSQFERRSGAVQDPVQDPFVIG